VNFFGRHEGKTFLQVETELVTKHTFRTRTCSIRFFGTRIQNMPEQIKVLLHTANLPVIRKHLSACGEAVNSLYPPITPITDEI
jgi:hypothetical protein